MGSGAARTVLLAAVIIGFSCVGCATAPFVVTEISPGILAGRHPSTEADYEALKAHGVRTVLSLEIKPWSVATGRREAKNAGLIFRNAALLPSPLQPSEHNIRKALLILNDQSLRPIFIHCDLGRDRTALVAALYRVYYEGWTPEAAWNEMLRTGFKVSWTLRGLRTYFWTHTQKPEWVKSGQQSGGRERPAVVRGLAVSPG